MVGGTSWGVNKHDEIHTRMEWNENENENENNRKQGFLYKQERCNTDHKNGGPVCTCPTSSSDTIAIPWPGGLLVYFKTAELCNYVKWLGDNGAQQKVLSARLEYGSDRNR